MDNYVFQKTIFGEFSLPENIALIICVIVIFVAISTISEEYGESREALRLISLSINVVLIVFAVIVSISPIRVTNTETNKSVLVDWADYNEMKIYIEEYKNDEKTKTVEKIFDDLN